LNDFEDQEKRDSSKKDGLGLGGAGESSVQVMEEQSYIQDDDAFDQDPDQGKSLK